MKKQNYRKNNRCINCDKIISYKATRCGSCSQMGHIVSSNARKKMGKGQKNRFKNPKNHWNWQGGKSFEPYPLGWNNTFKEQIRYRDKYKCQLCGCHEVECNRKLDVHHIDYDKENLNPNNLISLCKFCHMKTNWNREYYYAYFIFIKEGNYAKRK